MTSYLSSLTTHYNSIKRLLPTHLSPDADNSISDASDSHVSRVLRAYYTEKGRPFPPWLGPDPNAPVRPQANYVSQNRQSNGAAMAPAFSSPAKRGGLGDLFGDSPSQPQPQTEEPLSLRSRRGAFKAQTPTVTAASSSQPSQATQATARPLPSQRQGSYQNRSSDSTNNNLQPVMREQTAQERLRARLGGSRGASPAATPSPSANFDLRSSDRSGSGYNPYESSGDGGYNSYDYGDGGGGGYNPYEGGGGGGGAGGGSGFNPYDSGSANPYAASSSSSQRPYASSNSPWMTGDDPADLGSGSGRRGVGLPSNPRSRR